MSSKLAVIANLRAMSMPKKVLLGTGGLGAAGLGIKSYLDSVSMPPSDELLMMDLPDIPEDKTGSSPKDNIDKDVLDGMFSSVSSSGGSTAPMSEAPSVTGNKATSSAKGGVKNASFLDDGILPAAAGGVGGYLIGQHLIAPHFARQQVAIAEQIAQGQSALSAAARNQRISPILAAAAGALLLSWLLSNTNKKREVKEHLGGSGNYREGLQGYDPHDRQEFTTDNRHSGG